MLGSEFIAAFRGRPYRVWENAVVDEAQKGALTPWPWVDVTLSDGDHSAVLRVQSDVLAVGSLEDHVRIPLTPSVAQDVCNVNDWLLPTPWLVYQTWRAASVKLPPTAMQPNLGANLTQYAAHSAVLDGQISSANGAGKLACGGKKSVVVSNIMMPGRVVIFGWYQPEPDVFTNKKSMVDPQRQPWQPLSNVHGDFYVDYSHGIRAIGGTCQVDGQTMRTEDLYKHPTLSKLVSNEGPVKTPRYPSRIKPPQGGGSIASFPPGGGSAPGSGCLFSCGPKVTPGNTEIGFARLVSIGVR